MSCSFLIRSSSAFTFRSEKKRNHMKTLKTSLNMFKHYKHKPSFPNSQRQRKEVGSSPQPEILGIRSYLNNFDLIWSYFILFDPTWSNLIHFEPIWSDLNQIINLIQLDLIWSDLNLNQIIQVGFKSETRKKTMTNF